MVFPVFLYGIEAWSLKNNDTDGTSLINSAMVLEKGRGTEKVGETNEGEEIVFRKTLSWKADSVVALN